MSFYDTFSEDDSEEHVDKLIARQQAEADKASAVMGVAEHLTWPLGAGWGVAAGLWYDSWVVGLGVYILTLFFVLRGYRKADRKAWGKLERLKQQLYPSTPSDKA